MANDHVTKYTFTGLLCEICHNQYKTHIKHKGKLISIFKNQERQRMNKYLVLESLDEPDSAEDQLVVYVINFINSRIIEIGLGDAGLSILHPTVSFQHAQFRIWNVYDPKIKQMKGQLGLIDNQSRYGTCVLIGRPVSLYAEEECCIIIKNTEVMLKNASRFGCVEQFICRKQYWAKHMVPLEAYHDVCAVYQPRQLRQLSASAADTGRLHKLGKV